MFCRLQRRAHRGYSGLAGWTGVRNAGYCVEWTATGVDDLFSSLPLRSHRDLASDQLPVSGLCNNRLIRARMYMQDGFVSVIIIIL